MVAGARRGRCGGMRERESHVEWSLQKMGRGGERVKIGSGIVLQLVAMMKNDYAFVGG